MLEIVFNESVLGSMEQAAINATHRKPENLFCFPLPLDRGDIQKEFAAAREPLAAFYAARQSVCFSIGVITPRLRWTRLVL